MSTVLKVVLGIVLGGLLLFGGCVVGCGLLWGQGEVASQQAEAERVAFGDSLAVTFDRPRQSGPDRRDVTVSGRIENPTPYAVSSAFVRLGLYNEEGVRLGETTAHVENIAPGEAAAFSEWTFLDAGGDVAEVRIQEIEGYRSR